MRALKVQGHHDKLVHFLGEGGGVCYKDWNKSLQLYLRELKDFELRNHNPELIRFTVYLLISL